MTDTRPPVAPVEGLVAEMSSLLHATFLNNLLRHTDVPHENRMLIQSQMDDFAAQLAQPFIARLARLEALISLADAACNYADQHCRAFPIATAPTTGEWFLVWDNGMGEWFIHQPKPFDTPPNKRYTHWRPLPPPPSNPPLPEVFTELGQALERLKEGR